MTGQKQIEKKEYSHNSTFAKWRVEEVLVRSVFNLSFVASRQVEASNPPIRKSAKRYKQLLDPVRAMTIGAK
jgi:hypothetical protein